MAGGEPLMTLRVARMALIVPVFELVKLTSGRLWPSKVIQPVAVLRGGQMGPRPPVRTLSPSVCPP